MIEPKIYKTFHGAKRGAVAMAERSDFDAVIISSSSGFRVRPAKFPWIGGSWADRVCARINAAGQNV